MMDRDKFFEALTQSSLNVKHTRPLHVVCPYCRTGGADLVMERVGDKTQVPEFRTPHKCGSCGKYFSLKLQYKIVGVPMEHINGSR